VTVDDIVDLGQAAVLLTLLISAPMLIAGMVIGLAISVVQSVTQIQEITLSFVPKIVAVMIVFVVFLPWMSELMIDYVQELLTGINDLVLPT